MTAKQIFYTADLIEYDGSDSGVYGDGCEPGDGQTMTSGWWSPGWSRFEVRESRENVEPDVYIDERDRFEDEPSPAEWLAQQLSQRLGAIERSSTENYRENGGGAIYACEPGVDVVTGASIMPAAHPEGFTSEEYAEAFRILGESNCLF